ncbi:MAG: AI-2E family transporter [Patescibacteria group bacterium]
MENSKFGTVGFYVLFGLMGLLVAMMWWPFWQVLALAGIVAVLFLPLYEKINLELKSPNWAATLSIFLILLIIVLPLWLIGQLLFNELVDVYNKFRLGQLSFSQLGSYKNFSPEMQTLLNSMGNDMTAIFSKFTSSAFAFAQQMLSNLATFFMSLFILTFTVFFFLRDSSKIKELFIKLSPLPANYEQELVAKVEGAIAGVVKGTFIIALLQGAVGVVGFLIFGLPQPLLWAAATVIASMVPTVGTALVIIPAVVYLFLTGHMPQAVGMIIWGVIVIGLVDNFASPRLIGKNLKIHPVLAFLSILGGLQLFGFLGFLFGPIIMAVLVALVDIYSKNLKK